MKEDRRVARILAASLVLIASMYLPVAELLTQVDVVEEVSANLLLSTILAALAGVVILLQGAWPVPVVAFCLLLTPGILGVTSANDFRHLQYMVPLFAFVAVAFIVLSPSLALLAERSLLGGALLVLPVWALVWITFDFTLPRASASVVPLAGVVLLVFSSSETRWVRITAISSVILLIGYLAVTTARMGFALTLMVLLIWVWSLSGWSSKMRAVVSGAVVIPSAIYWLGGTWQRDRLFGRDATIDIGPVSLNGEGRVEAAQLTLHPPSGSNIWKVVFGNGGGSSGQRLVDAGFILDKPHNEFIRVFVDGGLILTAALVALLVLPAVIGILNYQRTRDRALLLLPMLVSLILFGFSLTDNALSYIWLMLPAGVLVSWSRSQALNWTPATNQST